MASEIGFLKLHRCLMEKPIWLNSTPEQKTVLITILMMVNFSEKSWEWKGESFTAKPGQTITSIDSIMKYAGKGITIQNVRSSLLRFEKLGFLTNESTKTGRLITIVNWRVYQPLDDEPNKAINKEPTDGQQRANKEPTPKGEDNKPKKEKKEKIYTETFEEFYSVYPNSCTKEQTFSNWKSRLKTGVAELELIEAAKNYANEVNVKNTEKQYITKSTNFLGNAGKCMDYLPSVYVKEKPVIQGGRKITIER